MAELALIARSSALLLYHLRDDVFQVIDVPCALFWGHSFSQELVKAVEKLLFHLRLDEFSEIMFHLVPDKLDRIHIQTFMRCRPPVDTILVHKLLGGFAGMFRIIILLKPVVIRKRFVDKRQQASL